MMSTNEYVEVRNGGYYVAGTRIGLDLMAYDFREGRIPEEIFRSYPSIGALAKLYGAIGVHSRTSERNRQIPGGPSVASM